MMTTSIKTKYNYKSIMSLLHDKGITLDFKRYDARPKTSLDTTEVVDVQSAFDCTTRAMCTVFNVPYDEIFDKQLAYAKKYNSSTSSNNITVEIAREYGYHIYQFKLPMNMLKFNLIRPKGRYIMEMHNHNFAYIDGIIYDRTVEDFHPDIEVFLEEELIKDDNGKFIDYDEDAMNELECFEGNWFGYIFDPVIAIYHPQEEDDYWYPKGEIPEMLN